jgi:hypothetical protein
MPYQFTLSDDAMDDALSNAREEEADQNMKACIESCIEHTEGFAWRWRIVQSAKTPAQHKACAHLQRWCDERLREEWSELAEANELATNPDKYHGVRSSDFG